MRFGWMKFIDNWLGVPLCLLLSRYDRWSRPAAAPGAEAEISRLLLIKFFGLGSIVFISPALRLLRRRYPRARIVFLTFARNRELCELLPEIDEVLLFSPDSLWRLPGNVWRLLWHLRRLSCERVYNFEFHARFPAIVAYLSGAGQIVEFHDQNFYKGRWRSQKINYSVHEHVTNSFAHLVAGGGAVAAALPPTTLLVPPAAREEMARILAAIPPARVGGRLWLGVNVNASEMALERRWPLPYFAELLSRLHEEFKPVFFLLGAPGEREYVSALSRLLPEDVELHNLAGLFSLSALIAFLSECDLLISNDSGPLHLGGAVGIPTVSFFGPETPEHYGPLGPRHLIFYRSLPCSPCLSPLNMKSVSCPREQQCLTSLGPEEVYAQVRPKMRALLAARGYETAF